MEANEGLAEMTILVTDTGLTCLTSSRVAPLRKFDEHLVGEMAGYASSVLEGATCTRMEDGASRMASQEAVMEAVAAVVHDSEAIVVVEGEAVGGGDGIGAEICAEHHAGIGVVVTGALGMVV
jgi:hypothetical protein